MRKKLLYICGILWVFAFFQLIINYEEAGGDIVTAFTNDNYLNTTSYIDAAALYGGMYLDDNEKKEVVSEVARELGINEPYELTIEDTESGTVTKLEKEASSVVTTITLTTVEKQVSAEVISLKQYVMVNMEVLNSLESGVYYREKIEKLFDDKKMSADVYLSLKGSISGTISNSEKNNITNNIINEMGGKIVTESRTNEIFTVYAFSDKIDDYVVYGTTKTNINVVIRYNELKNTTEVYMATPILNMDF